MPRLQTQPAASSSQHGLPPRSLLLTLLLYPHSFRVPPSISQPHQTRNPSSSPAAAAATAGSDDNPALAPRHRQLLATPTVIAELYGDVLCVLGTNGPDNIQISQTTANGLRVYSGTTLVKQVDVAKVRALQVQGLDGDDTIDLRGNGSPVRLPAWIHGGQGSDDLYGGAASDHIYGGGGTERGLSGGAEQDFIWGDVNGTAVAIDGGAGKNYVSAAPGNRSTPKGATDIDIEALDYNTRVLLEVRHRFRDPWGYSVMVRAEKIDGQGDATLKTALSAVATALAAGRASGSALTALNEDTKAFLQTILSYSWDAGGNPIRHPTQLFYTAAGVPLMVRPMSKDSMGGIVAACYYTYTSSKIRSDVKAVARQLMQKYIDYLVANQFRLITAYNMQQILGEIYTRNDDGTFSKPKRTEGPDTFTLLPTDVYALQEVAAKMGFVTSAWNPWQYLSASVAQTLADYLAEYLANGKSLPATSIAGATIVSPYAGAVAYFLNQGGLNGVLQNFKFTQPYSVSWNGKVLFSGTVKLELPQAARTLIVSMFKATIRESVRAGTLATVQFPSVASLILDKSLSSLPPALTREQWLPGLTGTLQDVLPWLDGSNLQAASTFVFATEYLRYQFGENKGSSTLIDAIAAVAANSLSLALLGIPIPERVTNGEQAAKKNWFAVHLGFWPTILMQETRPEMVDLTGPFVKLFAKSIEIDNNGLWAQLAGDGVLVDKLLAKFPAGDFERLSLAWEHSQEETTRDQADANLNRHHSRVDYLILKGLKERGRPKNLGKTAADWTKRWSGFLTTLANNAVAKWTNMIKTDLPKFAQALVTEFGKALKDVAGILMKVAGNMNPVAQALSKMGASPTAVMDALVKGIGGVYADMGKALLSVPGVKMEDVARAFKDAATLDLPNVAYNIWKMGMAKTYGDVLGPMVRSLKEFAPADLGEYVCAL